MKQFVILTWAVNGNTYDASKIYLEPFITVDGDSIRELNLVVIIQHQLI